MNFIIDKEKGTIIIPYPMRVELQCEKCGNLKKKVF